MSQENVEAVKRAVEANNRHDYEALLEEFVPDIEWHTIFGAMFGGEATVVRGHEGLLEYLRDQDEASPCATWRRRSSATLANELSFSATFEPRGRESGIELDSPWAGVAEFKSGKVVRLRDYSTTAKPSMPPGCGVVDRLPTTFGPVRAPGAPDHPKIVTQMQQDDADTSADMAGGVRPALLPLEPALRESPRCR